MQTLDSFFYLCRCYFWPKHSGEYEKFGARFEKSFLFLFPKFVPLDCSSSVSLANYGLIPTNLRKEDVKTTGPRPAETSYFLLSHLAINGHKSFISGTLSHAEQALPNFIIHGSRGQTNSIRLSHLSAHPGTVRPLFPPKGRVSASRGL